ncbi:MAG: hypothetical protein IJV80_01560 [Clostridia bacterium]|nr:hypothetical protein [Clostridia bacterium]
MGNQKPKEVENNIPKEQQANVCAKYGLGRAELWDAVKAFLGLAASKYTGDPVALVAITDLLYRGDIEDVVSKQ